MELREVVEELARKAKEADHAGEAAGFANAALLLTQAFTNLKTQEEA